MGFLHTFIDRPVLSSVISILIVIIGGISYFALPVAQYPEIAPPTVQVSASYAGASAEVVADTVATVIEQEINGVENMLYMRSENTSDGRTVINVVFELGTDLDTAQVLVQNRVALAEPRLPEEVRRTGVIVRKSSPDLMMVIHIESPDESRDQLYISNYARINVLDQLARIRGVGNATIFGEQAYSMRVWLNPDRIRSFDMTAGEVVNALQTNNVQVAAGTLNRLPIPEPGAFELQVQTQGRLLEAEEFENIVIKRGDDGRLVRLADVARVELAAQEITNIAYLDNKPALPIGIFQLPGSNALATAERIIETMESLSEEFPSGISYRIVYNPTEFIEESINEVIRTLFEATALVILVIVVFLQSIRTSIIPVLAIPVSLIGTFAVLAALGFSLNSLSLFGLVLAIGIVVDDAIVVVENVERYLAQGMSAREATHKTMDEVGGALIATSSVLLAVFIPTAFITGISGQFYEQFAVTIAVSTVFSTIVSLTLSPALCAILLKPEHEKKPSSGIFAVINKPVEAFAQAFNATFDKVSGWYGGLTKRIIRMAALVMVVYVGLIGLAGFGIVSTPTGFIPEQDQGYLITVVQLPPAASLARTDEVVQEASEALLALDGIEHAVAFAGLDGSTFTNSPNAGVIFVTLPPFHERPPGMTDRAVIGQAFGAVAGIKEAQIFFIAPPPVRGIGTGGGWKLYVQDRRGRGVEELEQAVFRLMFAANEQPVFTNVFTQFNSKYPNIYADIDRVRAQMLGVPTDRLLETLEVYLGSTYVNDFNFLGRTYRVVAQADAEFRDEPEDVLELRTRSENGGTVPIGSVATLEQQTSPYRVTRYNLYKAAELIGAAPPGVSTGQVISAMERMAPQVLPEGFGFEWTELALQEKLAGNTAMLAFGLAVVFVFLVLAALYESWLLPLAVILIVPMCLLAAITGVIFRGLDNNILVQIGFVVLIGLAAKNAILIVEFARQAEQEGMTRVEAAIEAARVRLRPILMTSLAFILGVIPLVTATGAGAEMRQSLGTAVFAGMIGVTFFGLLFTPVFYALCRWLGSLGGKRQSTEAASFAE